MSSEQYNDYEDREYGTEWSHNSGSTGYLNENGILSMKVEEFRPRNLTRQISQSEPMVRRTVKDTVCYNLL